MHPILKKVKQEFSDCVKENKIKIKHQKSSNIETLSLLPSTNNRKKSIKIDFFYIPDAQATDVKITYTIKLDNKSDKIISYVFSNLSKKLELPVIEPDLISSIKANFNYEVNEGKIVSTVPAQTQVDTFISTVKSSWEKIINYSDSLTL